MEQYNYMPIGTVVSYAGATTPIGWLLCDGRTIEEHEYPDLYKVLGSGILPDLRGEFGQIIKAFNTTTDTETLPIQMAKALNNKIENNYNDQLDATVDIVGKEFYDYIQNSGEKTAGKIYRDRLQKGIFRCLKTTTSVLNTSEFYESVSNNDLGNKLQNLTPKSVILNVIRWTQPIIGPDNMYDYIAIIEQPPCSFDKVIGAVCIDGPYGTETLQYVYELNLWRYIFRSPLPLDCTKLTMWKCAKIIYLD